MNDNPPMDPTPDDPATWGPHLPIPMVEAICTELEALGWDIEHYWTNLIEAQWLDPDRGYAMRFSGWIISWHRIDGHLVYGIGDDLIGQPHRAVLDLAGSIDDPKAIAFAADRAMHLLWHQEQRDNADKTHADLERHRNLKSDVQELARHMLVTPGQLRAVIADFEARKISQ